MRHAWMSLLLGIEALALSPMVDSQQYLWTDRLAPFDRSCFTRLFKPPSQYFGGVAGSVLVTGTERITIPLYDFTSAEISDSADSGALALLNLAESWAEQTFNDHSFCDEFRLLTYRPIFPTGCAFICSRRPYGVPSASLSRGEVNLFWTGAMKQEVISETLSRFGTEQDWPLLRAATAAWIQHPCLNQQEVNALLDQELLQRALLLEKDPSLKKCPVAWTKEPGILLLEHLESKGNVVLSLKKIPPSREYPGHFARFAATVGCRTSHTTAEGERLVFECIEYLQQQLPSIAETLAAMPPDLDPREAIFWFQRARVPINLVFNFPINSAWDAQSLTNASFGSDDYTTGRLAPLTSLNVSTSSGLIYEFMGRKLSAEEFPKTKAFSEAVAELYGRRFSKGQASPEAHAQ